MILITGATGFIGSRTVAALARRGAAMRVLYRDEARLSRLDRVRFDAVRGDILDAASLAPAMAGCTACLHLASARGRTGLPPEKMRHAIVEGTRIVLEAARRAGVKRVVHTSSAAAVNATGTPTPVNESAPFDLAGRDVAYPEAKKASEEVARQFAGRDGMEVVIVNPTETFGPDDRDWHAAGAVRDILKTWPGLAVPGGASVVHVEDVADGVIAALDRGRNGERYILGGDNITYAELVRLVLDIAGLKRPVVTVPLPVLRAAVAVSRGLGAKPPIDPALLPYLRYFWYVDCGKAKRELGYAPRGARAVFEPTVKWVQAAMRA